MRTWNVIGWNRSELVVNVNEWDAWPHRGKGLTGLALALCSSVERGPLLPLPDSEGSGREAQLTRHFLARKREEYDALRLEIERLERESDS